MRAIFSSAGVVCSSSLLLVTLHTHPLPAQERAGQAVEKSARVIERGAHHAKWESVREVVDPESGQTVSVTNSYVQLETGLHFEDEQGQWVEASEEIEIIPGFAVAKKGQHQARWAANINTYGAIELWTPEGEYLRSHVLGIAYYDPTTGESVTLGEVQDSTGFVDGNKVMYENAFSGIQADLRYTYTKSGFEQDVVLREQLPNPADLGLDPATVQLQILTEFVSLPAAMTNAIRSPSLDTAGLTNSITNIETYGRDQPLEAGGMQMGYGRAFRLQESNREYGIPVRKSLERFDGGRSILVETIEVDAIEDTLRELPSPDRTSASLAPLPKAKRLAGLRHAPAAPAYNGLPAGKAFDPMHAKMLARLDSGFDSRKGYVIDYVTLNSTASSLVLRGDTTYHVTGAVSINGKTTIEGGTVVKFKKSPSGTLNPKGTIECKTSLYAPAIFTAEDDNSIGEWISGSTGQPTGYYGNPWALLIDFVASDLKYIHVRHAKVALYYNSFTYSPATRNYEGHPHNLAHSQITHCETAINSFCPVVNVRNTLFYSNLEVVDTQSAVVTVNLEHVTVNSATALNANSSWITLNVANSLLVAVTSLGTYNNTGGNAVLSSASGVFQTLGSAKHYLAPGSPHRNAGVPGISYQLQADFRQMTTFAPTQLENIQIASPVTWSTTAPRDVDLPDRGYHYPVLDYAVTGVDVQGGNLTIGAGVRVGVYFNSYSGIQLGSGSTITSIGKPTDRNVFVKFNYVGEQFDSGSASPVWSYDGAMINTDSPSYSVVPVTNFRFTDFYTVRPADLIFLLNWPANSMNLSIRDCEFLNGTVETGRPSVSAVNCLFRGTRALFNFGGGGYSQTWYNNTMHRGEFRVYYGGGLSFTIKDNFFNNVDFYQYPASGDVPIYSANYNGYVLLGGLSSERISPNGANDITLVDTVIAPAFSSGPMGDHYLAASSTLVGAGSRAASSAGLHHYTTSVAQLKEGSEANSTVNVGYHYVAVVPAEEEINKGTMTASASSTCCGWVPANAINGSVTDAGWVNNLYTNANEYLQIDLGASKTISRFGYIPRQLTTQSPAYDGNSNGAIKDYELYVSDSSSSWGTPVYSGEWNWPNGAERRDVAFGPKAGRYITLKRINAFGWYGPYEPNSTPSYGFAGANEVWIYKRNGPVPVPIDLDGDTIHDYIEDLNGDGVGTPNSTGETDWDSVYNSPNGHSTTGAHSVHTPLE